MWQYHFHFGMDQYNAMLHNTFPLIYNTIVSIICMHGFSYEGWIIESMTFSPVFWYCTIDLVNPWIKYIWMHYVFYALIVMKMFSFTT